MMAQFDFDEVIDRRQTPALKVHPIVLGKDGGSLFPAGVADMDFRVAPVICDALERRLAHGVFGYETVPDGLLPALSTWLAERHGWSVGPPHILRAPNALNSLAIAISLFSDAGDGVIVQPPVFFDFFDIIRENKRCCIENPLILRDGRYEMDFDGLERLASEPDNKVLFLCNPHNPVGRVWTAAELTRLGEICMRHGVIVVSDELHGDIVFSEHRYTPFASLGPAFADNAISLVSPAKSFNIAACCSSFTIIGNEERRRAFQAENSRLTVNKNNAMANVAMEAAYRDGEPWLGAVMTYIEGNLELVRTRLADLDGVDLIEPEGTFLLWLDFRGMKITPEALADFLRKKAGWATTRGIAFGEQGAGFARMNIACRRASLSQAIDQLAAALKTQRN